MIPEGTAHVRQVVSEETFFSFVGDRLWIFRTMRDRMRQKLLDDLGIFGHQHAVHWLRKRPGLSLVEYEILVPPPTATITADDKMAWRTDNPLARRRRRVHPIRPIIGDDPGLTLDG